MSKHAKPTVVKNPPSYVEEDFDFDDDTYDDFDRDRAAADVMQGMLESARFEAETALSLTKLYMENISALNVTKELLFATYKEALQVAAESSPVKKMLGDMRTE